MGMGMMRLPGWGGLDVTLPILRVGLFTRQCVLREELDVI